MTVTKPIVEVTPTPKKYKSNTFVQTTKLQNGQIKILKELIQMQKQMKLHLEILITTLAKILQT